ncbi:MAG: hypothetical protein IPG93_12155 [Burkholderiales bacterium]|nr:hypothetical protein [Burkholderiales bacterium]
MSIALMLSYVWLPAAAQGSSAAAASTVQAGPRSMATACRADPARPDLLLATTPGLTLAIVPERWPIPVGRHFSVELTVCADRPGVALPTLIGLDGDMPLHRHGMNYRASIEPLGAGLYRARGLMFHMPGRWRFTAELAEPAGATRRLTVGVDVP